MLGMLGRCVEGRLAKFLEQKKMPEGTNLVTHPPIVFGVYDDEPLGGKSMCVGFKKRSVVSEFRCGGHVPFIDNAGYMVIPCGGPMKRTFRGEVLRSHRLRLHQLLVWLLFGWDEQMDAHEHEVCHTCHYKRCINPMHVLEGSHADNQMMSFAINEKDRNDAVLKCKEYRNTKLGNVVEEVMVQAAVAFEAREEGDSEED